MSNSKDESVLMIHGLDGEAWVKFLAAKLEQPEYNIKSAFVDIDTLLQPPSTTDYTPNAPEGPLYSNDTQTQNTHQVDDDSAVYEALHPSSNQNIPTKNTNISSTSSSIQRRIEKFSQNSSTSDNGNLDNSRSSTISETINRTSNLDTAARTITNVCGDNTNNTIENDNDNHTTTKDNSTNAPENNTRNSIVQCKGIPSQNADQSQETNSKEDNRVKVIFITPFVIEGGKKFNADMETQKSIRRTVFLFLGLEYLDVTDYFGQAYYEYVSQCRCTFIDGSEQSIREGLMLIIEAFEDISDEDSDDGLNMIEYHELPNKSIQRNEVEKVFPSFLTEAERDVYLLLLRKPEEEVSIVVLDRELSLSLVYVCDRLYMFTLPAGIYGDVTFDLECQDRRFGRQSIHAYSKMDLIHKVINSEVNPHSLIASSFGLDKDDTGGLDTHLAFKLQELAPVMSFEALCPCEDALKDGSSEELSNKMWPTLLHFAADLNLRLFCSELLRYPGMVAAACTENRDGEFPSQIASRKGYYQLEDDLIQYMRRHRKALDPDYNVLSSQCNISSKDTGSLTDVSNCHTADNMSVNSVEYCDMKNVESLNMRKQPLLDRIRQKPRALSDSSLFRRKINSKKKYISHRSDSGYTPERPAARTQSDVSRSSSNTSRRPLPRRPDSPIDDKDSGPVYSNTPDGQASSSREGSPLSIKALKRLGATEEEVASRYSAVDPNIAETAAFFSATCPPGSLKTRLFFDDDDNMDRISISSNCDNPEVWTRSFNSSNSESKRQAKKDKGKSSITLSIFNKFKGNKKTPSEADLIGKKYSGSKIRRGSEPANKKVSSSLDEERDSGSYSDEEKKEKVFRERKQPMTRRVSRRIEYAKKESYEPIALPKVPGTEKKRSTFRSFISD